MEQTIHQLAIAEVRQRLRGVTEGRRFFAREDFSIQMDADQGILRDGLRLLRVPARLSESRIVLIERGSGAWRLNFSDLSASAPCIVLLPDKAMLQVMSVSQDFRCHVIAFTEAGHFEAIGSNVIGLAPDDAEDFSQMFRLIWRLCGKSPFPEDIVRPIIVSLLRNCSRLAVTQMSDARPIQASRKEEIFHRFLSLVATNIMSHRALAFYADTLCISVHYLCESVHDASGHYPKYWIDRTLVSEAKYLLGYTDRSAAAIAGELNFSTPAFFCRFFKRETGLTPGEFRRRKGYRRDGKTPDNH